MGPYLLEKGWHFLRVRLTNSNEFLMKTWMISGCIYPALGDAVLEKQNIHLAKNMSQECVAHMPHLRTLDFAIDLRLGTAPFWKEYPDMFIDS